MKIYLVDAFTTEPFTGNPAGVVIADNPHEQIDETLMQNIAREINASETVFAGFSSERNQAEIPVRYFTPTCQIDFCGHATLALFHMLKETEQITSGKFLAGTRLGPVPVEVESREGKTVIAMTQRQASFESFDKEAELLQALGLEKEDLDNTFPLHLARAANKHLIAALKENALAKIKMEASLLGPLLDKHGAATLHVFARRSGSEFSARNFGPHIGIMEDPATGSAALAFGAYLHHFDKLGQRKDFSIIQGEDMGRPGKIDVEVRAGKNFESVKISGHAVKTFSLSLGSLSLGSLVPASPGTKRHTIERQAIENAAVASRPIENCASTIWPAQSC